MMLMISIAAPSTTPAVQQNQSGCQDQLHVLLLPTVAGTCDQPQALLQMASGVFRWCPRQVLQRTQLVGKPARHMYWYSAVQRHLRRHASCGGVPQQMSHLLQVFVYIPWPAQLYVSFLKSSDLI
jgi:hypothetical protein